MKYYVGEGNKYRFPKFDYQMMSLKSMGYDVFYIGFDDTSLYLCNNREKTFLRKLPTSKIDSLNNILFYSSLFKATKLVFDSDIKFEYAYIRYMVFTPTLILALKRIRNKKTKIIIEIPTHPIKKEIRSEKFFLKKYFYFYSHFLLVKYAKYVDLFALIGETSSSFAKRPVVNIENGISLDVIPIRNKSENKENDVHLLGLANMARWHGYDRIIKGIKNYSDCEGKRNVYLHLVGSDGDGSLEEWRNLTLLCGLEKHIIFEGPKYDKELDYYFDLCHLAIGSIGLHRIGIPSASTLKLREYVTRGIPFVISSTDVYLDPNFYIQVPNDDSDVDINLLVQYIENNDSSNIKGIMREFAEQNFTWNTQFEKIFRFFQ